MQYEKIIKDERGTIRIKVSLYISHFCRLQDGKWFRYNTTVYHAPKGKRKESISYHVATHEEILQAKKELWQKLDPELE